MHDHLVTAPLEHFPTRGGATKGFRSLIREMVLAASRKESGLVEGSATRALGAVLINRGARNLKTGEDIRLAASFTRIMGKPKQLVDAVEDLELVMERPIHTPKSR